jgi:hypothetical protein
VPFHSRARASLVLVKRTPPWAVPVVPMALAIVLMPARLVGASATRVYGTEAGGGVPPPPPPPPQPASAARTDPIVARRAARPTRGRAAPGGAAAWPGASKAGSEHGERKGAPGAGTCCMQHHAEDQPVTGQDFRARARSLGSKPFGRATLCGGTQRWPGGRGGAALSCAPCCAPPFPCCSSPHPSPRRHHRRRASPSPANADAPARHRRRRSSREANERTLVVVLDPSPELAKGGLRDAFAAALAANAKTSWRRRRIASGRGRREGPLVVAADPRARAGGAGDRRPRSQREGGYFQQRVHVGARGGGRAGGARAIAPCSSWRSRTATSRTTSRQTVATLQKAKVRVEMLTSEATLADSYWAENVRTSDKPRGADDDRPGWRGRSICRGAGCSRSTPRTRRRRLGCAVGLQPSRGHDRWPRVPACERVQQTAHKCGFRSQCLFCNGDHAPRGRRRGAVCCSRSWRRSSAARDESLADDRRRSELPRDGRYLACFRAGRPRSTGTAGQARRHLGERSRPRPGARSAPDSRPRASRVTRRAPSRPPRRRTAARRRARRRARGIAPEDARSRAASRRGAVHRRHAAAHARQLDLTYAAWCRDVARSWSMAPRQHCWRRRSGGRRRSAPGRRQLHQPEPLPRRAPFFATELPGGEKLRTELERLDALYLATCRVGVSCPFGLLLRHNGIARFWPAFPAVAGPLPRCGRRVPPSRRDPSRPADRRAPGVAARALRVVR